MWIFRMLYFSRVNFPHGKFHIKLHMWFSACGILHVKLCETYISRAGYFCLGRQSVQILLLFCVSIAHYQIPWINGVHSTTRHNPSQRNTTQRKAKQHNAKRFIYPKCQVIIDTLSSAGGADGSWTARTDRLETERTSDGVARRHRDHEVPLQHRLPLLASIQPDR